MEKIKVKETYVVGQLGYLRTPEAFRQKFGTLTKLGSEPTANVYEGTEDGDTFVEISYKWRNLKVKETEVKEQPKEGEK
jgi:hypothetical protein